jgi:hypothetical protein
MQVTRRVKYIFLPWRDDAKWAKERRHSWPTVNCFGMG